MSLREKLKNLFFKVEDTIFCEYGCIGCDSEIPDNTPLMLCKTCMSNIQFITGKTCKICGEPIGEDYVVCEDCKDVIYDFSKNTSVCIYGDISGGIVKQLKYSGKKYLAKHIAAIMATRKEAFENIDVITYVPISKKREKVRGFNQSAEIAKVLGEIKGLPVLSLLIKTKDSRHQASLSRVERMKNLKDSFDVALDAKDKIKDKNILIIDDVFTTGTTLSECARVLKKCNPKFVGTLTFAKTDLKR